MWASPSQAAGLRFVFCGGASYKWIKRCNEAGPGGPLGSNSSQQRLVAFVALIGDGGDDVILPAKIAVDRSSV
jgi:hypothetical protein